MSSSDAASRAWHTLSAPPPPELTDAWRQLHWAAQVPAALASAIVERQADDGHLNLGWSEPLAALVTRAAGSVSAGLRLADRTLLLLKGPSVSAEYPLAGHNLDEALAWMREEAGLDAELVLPSWDMPDHALRSGGRFETAAAAAFEEVARWYSDADLVLGELAAATEGASEVRCWPHHFDLATLVTLEPAGSAEQAHTVGIGLAPADDSLAEPYVYANPWPAPEMAAPPTLEAGGEWHRQGWFGAVLRATRLLAGNAAGQRERLELFLRSAVAADRRLLGEED